MVLKKGFIYKARREHLCKHPHPIVVIDDTPGAIKSCIISHDSTNNQIQLSAEHFEQGPAYTCTFDATKPSYLVQKKYGKVEGDFENTPCGKVTDNGLKFINEKVGSLPLITHNKPVWKP